MGGKHLPSLILLQKLKIALKIKKGKIMQLHTKEHQELIEQFERDYPHFDKNKEDKNLWAEFNRIYQDGKVNEIFLAYRCGYSFGRGFY